MASENPNPFGFCSSANSIFSNTNSKETLTDSESSRLRERHEKMDEIERIRRDFPSGGYEDPAVIELEKKISSDKARKTLGHYKETNNDDEYEFIEKEKFEYYKETNEEIEERRRLDHLAAMWPVISANTKSFCIDDDDNGNGIAVQIAEANKSFSAAIKAVTSYAATAAATAAAAAPRMEQLKLETKALLDSQTQFGSVYEYPELSELDHKKLSNNACKALEHYKETNGEEYEFVENKKFENGILPPFLASHITFTAKPKEKADSCPKLFFAELYRRFGHDDYEVKMCMNLDSCSPDIKKGCGYIHGDKDMLHPSGVKFWTGPLSGTPEWDEWRARNSSSRT